MTGAVLGGKGKLLGADVGGVGVGGLERVELEVAGGFVTVLLACWLFPGCPLLK